LPPLRVDQPGRQGRDRLEILTALIGAPSFDPLFRTDLIRIPPGHPVYRWQCLVTDCERAVMGHGDLCSAHMIMWRPRRDAGESKADFLRTAPPVGPSEGGEERWCRICPERPARQLTLELCQFHQFHWYRRRRPDDPEAGFDEWLDEQKPLPGYGGCQVAVCSEPADSPLGLCYRQARRHRAQGRPGAAVLPSQWGNRFERGGRPVPVDYTDEPAFRKWCAQAEPVLRPGQVNLRGLPPLLRAEFQWGMYMRAEGAHGFWELSQVQGLADHCRARGVGSLTDLDADETAILRDAVGREAVRMAQAIAGWLFPL
jgi:hypothetical protein